MVFLLNERVVSVSGSIIMCPYLGRFVFYKKNLEILMKHQIFEILNLGYDFNLELVQILSFWKVSING